MLQLMVVSIILVCMLCGKVLVLIASSGARGINVRLFKPRAGFDKPWVRPLPSSPASQHQSLLTRMIS